MTESSRRHRWHPNVNRVLDDRGDHIKSERTCMNEGCIIIKVTRHQWSERKHWIEFYDGETLERIQCEGTPECQGAVPLAKLGATAS